MTAEPLMHSRSSASRRAPLSITSGPSVEICNAMVRLYKEAFGRGPTKARTFFAGPDTVLVVLEETLTVAERTLLALGEFEALRKSHMPVQEELEERARSLVESVLGRQTLAFITGIDPRRDIAVNVFTLQSAAGMDDHQNGPVARPRSAR